MMDLEQLRTVLDALPLHTAIGCDTDGTPDGVMVEHVSPYSLNHIEHIGAAVGRKLGEYPEYVQSVGIPIIRALRTREPQQMELFENREGRGWYLGDIYPIGAGRVLIIYTAVTELAMDKLAAEKAAKQAAAMNARFVRACAHDLRAPIRAVANFTEILRDHADSDALPRDKQVDFLTRAHNGSLKALDMLSELRSYALETTGNGYVPVAPADQVILAGLDYIREKIEEAGGSVVTELDIDGGPFEVTASISRVVQNLVDNSLKYAGDEPPRIVLSAAVANGELTVQVTDEGMGFEPEASPYIFELFHRLKPQDETPGLGMGLALCREIVTQKGGSIWATSPGRGKGSTVAFRVPVAQPPEGSPNDDRVARGG